MTERECEHCGEIFQTLTRLRLHDCPSHVDFIDQALIPDPTPKALPKRGLTDDEFEAIKSHESIGDYEEMMRIPADIEESIISIVIEVDGSTYGLHSDHDTAEWEVTVKGNDYQQIQQEHREWLAEEIARVEGGKPPDTDNISPDIPKTVTQECEYCDDTHELQRNFDPSLVEMGQFEYTGYCEETGRTLSEINPDNLLDHMT